MHYVTRAQFHIRRARPRAHGRTPCPWCGPTLRSGAETHNVDVAQQTKAALHTGQLQMTPSLAFHSQLKHFFKS
jgi:hypothetical protein